MSRRSRSPRRRVHDDDDFRAPGGSGYNSRRERGSEMDREYGRQSTRDRDGGRDYKKPRRDDERRPERDTRDYDERRRERERERDRERYDSRSAREREDTSSRGRRRSASPRSRSSKPQETETRSRSGSIDPVADKSKPNFAPSGLLAAETNTVKAVDGTSTVLKYNEPPEARKPILGWRLYVFKDTEQVGEYSFPPSARILSGLKRIRTSSYP